MNARMLGLFSGFPERQFPEAIAIRLKAELPERECLVFVSAWPADHARNDEDAAGMHGMFAKCGMAFRRFSVIDSRTDKAAASELIREADCIFLMGGHAVQQMQLIREKEIAEAIRQSRAVILGVSAGAYNMAKRALDILESRVPYEGLGLTDVTVKAHVREEDRQLLNLLKQISREQRIPIFAMKDNSAIFVAGDDVSCIGEIWLIRDGEIQPFSPEMIN